MLINNTNITRQDIMPKYEIGGNYRDRMYQVYQDIYQRKYGQAMQAPVEAQQQAQAQPNTMAQ